MKNIFLFSLLIFAISFNSCKEDEPSGQETQQVELKNDSYTPNANKTFFATGGVGMEFGVVLGPISNTFQVTHIQFLFGHNSNNDPDERDMILKIYKDDGSIDPGEILYSKTHTLTGSQTTMHEINVTSENVSIAGGSIRVAFEILDTDGMPSLAYEQIGTQQVSRNWVYYNDIWQTSNDLGMPGNFVIRAVVNENI